MGYFYGWYFKCQSDTQTFAVIPAVHQRGRKRTCSIQIITEGGSWTVNFPGDAYCRRGKTIFIGNNRFGKKGIRLDINTPEICAKGRVYFSKLSPLKYDVMGPFALLPFMECRHSVFSMKHLANGKMCINEQEFIFDNDTGYWEGDRGRSFPKEYAWTQSSFKGGSLMLSVADIPFAGIHFTGVIAVVMWHGREYRLATYLGARAVRIKDGAIRIIQGDMELEACMLERDGQKLNAPTHGNMTRIIHEKVACPALYKFRKKGRTIFEFETNQASFEYEYPK